MLIPYLEIAFIFAVIVACLSFAVWIGFDIYDLYFKKEVVEIQKKQITKESIELTTEIQKIIDQLIEFQTFAELQQSIHLEEKYDILKVDSGIKKVANKVYEYLQPELFQSGFYIIKSEKWMDYIASRTSAFFIAKVLEHNAKIQ